LEEIYENGADNAPYFLIYYKPGTQKFYIKSYLYRSVIGLPLLLIKLDHLHKIKKKEIFLTGDIFFDIIITEENNLELRIFSTENNNDNGISNINNNNNININNDNNDYNENNIINNNTNPILK
jgi:hypothetical protein